MQTRIYQIKSRKRVRRERARERKRGKLEQTEAKYKQIKTENRCLRKSY